MCDEKWYYNIFVVADKMWPMKIFNWEKCKHLWMVSFRIKFVFFFLIKVFCVFSQERHWKVPVINFHFVQVNQHAIVQSMVNATIQLQPKALGEQLVLQCMFFFSFSFFQPNRPNFFWIGKSISYTIFDFILSGNVCYLQGKSFIFFYTSTERYMLFWLLF